MSYFDSAYIAKFYVDEPESDAVRRLAETLARRATAYRKSDFIRFLTVEPDHDATYGKK